jgi:HD-GYP domain-containing protein (c-di-GMP phosphodiesterase class II)
MVRMSDLVRGIVRESPPPPPPARPAPPAPPETPEHPPERVVRTPRTSLGTLEAPAPEAPAPPRDEPAAPPREPAAAPPPVRQAGPATLGHVPDRAPGPPAESPQALFDELQSFMVQVRDVVRAGAAVSWPRLEGLVDRVAIALRDSADLFWIANGPGSASDGDYLALHQARVGVLAVRIGTALGYDRARLTTLGMAGCLIDVSLWQLPEGITRKMDTATGEEQTLYRSHARQSADLIRRWDPPSDRIPDAVLEHHERERGQGFPQGLQGPAIDGDAKILGLVDTYTALTAPPAARPRLRPHEAIREIVKSRHDEFPSTLIKALLAEISVFPPGTVVRLNTEEIARVIAVNRNHPLRPRVEVLADGKGHRLHVPKALDLSEAPFLYITGPVAETH